MSDTINYYVATIRNGSEMTDFKTLSTNNGYYVRIAKCSDGSLKTQALLFPKSTYTFVKAHISACILEKAWV